MLELLGDKWSLMIIRDMIFGNRRHFRDLLDNSEERIASNMLADRLKTLCDRGLLTKAEDPSHKQKVIYSLTEQGIDLLPLLVQMVGWGHKYLPVSKQHGLAAQVIMYGGPKMWRRFMSELRVEHLHKPGRSKPNARAPSIATMFWQHRSSPIRKPGKRPRRQDSSRFF